jgi:hypothetical protein
VRAPRRAAALLLVGALLATAGACRESRPPEDLRADELWEKVREAPELRLLRAFDTANTAAARRHGDPHDRDGVGYQLRGLEGYVLSAELTEDPAEKQQIAGQVADLVDELERGDLLRLYEEVRPGAGAQFRALRDRARKLLK